LVTKGLKKSDNKRGTISDCPYQKTKEAVKETRKTGHKMRERWGSHRNLARKNSGSKLKTLGGCLTKKSRG